MLLPDIILPSQQFGSRPRLAPEHRLMIAVLQDAIDCVAKYRYAKDYRGRRLLQEATQWFLAEDADWPYSFECICAVLDLDANAVRCALRLPERESALVVREVKKVPQNPEELQGLKVTVKNGVAAARNGPHGEAAHRGRGHGARGRGAVCSAQDVCAS